MRRYKTPDPHGGNTFGDRCAGAFVGFLFGLPVIGLWWIYLDTALDTTAAQLPFRTAVLALVGLAAFGFLWPKALPSLYGGLWEWLGHAFRWGP